MEQGEWKARLKALRDELDGVDTALIELATRRQQLVSDIGRIKKRYGEQLRDFRREREVLDGVRRAAESRGLDPELAEDLFQRLIEASLTRQEQERLRLGRHGDGRRALVIGGSGRMGRWLAAFLDGQGFDVLIADPATTSDGSSRFTDWRDAPADVDVIAIAAPLAISAEVLAELAQQSTDALVFDIGSLKSPLGPALRAAADAGLRVCSVHPMFGPDTQLLSEKHVLLMDVGNAEAVVAAKSLFADTLAELVTIGLEEHDRLMAPVLGLSHALSIVFFTALADCGVSATGLSQLSSTTFDRQLSIARAVACENPDLYFEIQSLNRHGGTMRQALLAAVQLLIESIENDDSEAFRQLMARGKAYLSDLK
ncbi:prephenate dehydrogenase/arogenate dehydrogenase family protein [Wenzhouxiangella sp. XN201]|uniref:prephenate dehydrogenase/arogenate dehydrogenase family protein n=1 Tax=Wenzhouxiangella sp. XN201 TaxID=2710755 RepID=UPI0013C8F4C6|nr:prephenate dehydrogenase/arogenate dehydrogenase family protein [Wenzhouxiangella sp. XN201]NEZ03555.1 prephenate dehydrogenase/arogenate dehydrogenase family protein [Wenzhouxiangella sp. XN201]